MVCVSIVGAEAWSNVFQAAFFVVPDGCKRLMDGMKRRPNVNNKKHHCLEDLVGKLGRGPLLEKRRSQVKENKARQGKVKLLNLALTLELIFPAIAAHRRWWSVCVTTLLAVPTLQLGAGRVSLK